MSLQEKGRSILTLKSKYMKKLQIYEKKGGRRHLLLDITLNLDSL